MKRPSNTICNSMESTKSFIDFVAFNARKFQKQTVCHYGKFMCKTLPKHNDQKRDKNWETVLISSSFFQYIYTTDIYIWYLYSWEKKMTLWCKIATVVAWNGKGLSWIIKFKKLFSLVGLYLLLKKVKSALNSKVFIRLSFYAFRGNHYFWCWIIL